MKNMEEKKSTNPKKWEAVENIEDANDVIYQNWHELTESMPGEYLLIRREGNKIVMEPVDMVPILDEDGGKWFDKQLVHLPLSMVEEIAKIGDVQTFIAEAVKRHIARMKAT